MRAIPSQIAIAALAACALLSACGGGDGGDSGGTTSSQGGTPTPTPTPVPSPAPSPAPSPVPSPDPSPTPPRTGETLPSLSTPQPGSTAAVGNGSEGIWSEFGGGTFIDSTGRFVRAEVIGVVNGGFQFSGWSFAPDTIFEYMVPTNVTGSGTITLGSNLDGSYLKEGSDTPTTVHAIYDPANALAVDQASIQGSWKQDGFEMSVDEQGNVSGTYTNGTRICALTGTAVLAEAGSRKNLYRLNMTATVPTQPASTGCAMSVGIPHLGYAAIRFVPSDGSRVITSSTLYSRSLAMVASAGNGGYFMTQMRKQ